MLASAQECDPDPSPCLSESEESPLVGLSLDLRMRLRAFSPSGMAGSCSEAANDGMSSCGCRQRPWVERR
jgi:hypothetical protein